MSACDVLLISDASVARRAARRVLEANGLRVAGAAGQALVRRASG